MEIAKMSLFLFVVCAVAATALAFTDKVTRERIAENKAQVEAEARDAVLGAAREKAAWVKTFYVEVDGKTLTVYRYEDGDEKPLALVAKGSGKGFGGAVDFMMGVDPAGKVLGVRVISHQETPGLGTNVCDVKPGKEDKAWLAQLAGLAAPEVALTKDDPQGKVDAVTGVTISSRAVTRGAAALMARLAEIADELDEPKEKHEYAK